MTNGGKCKVRIGYPEGGLHKLQLRLAELGATPSAFDPVLRVVTIECSWWGAAKTIEDHILANCPVDFISEEKL